jgi:hypothetical protein
VSRPRTELDKESMKTLLELEIVSKTFFDLENKLHGLINSSLENKIPMRHIANAMGTSLFRVKYLSEKRRGVK